MTILTTANVASTRRWAEANLALPTLTGARSMISRWDVIEAYRIMLGRDPESEQVIQGHTNIRTVAELYRALMESDEFREVFTGTIGAAALSDVSETRLPLDLPPIEVESQASDARQLAAIFERTRSVWRQLGEREPYFSVCTDPRLLGGGIGELAEEFYASGEQELRNLTSFAARAGVDLTGQVCLELGCGVGRVTRWLARLFRRVQGVDVSAGHLAIAQQQLAGAGIDNVSLTQINNLADLRQIFGYDVLFSIIVLQHNPPPLIAYMLTQLLTNLALGGVAFFQVPTYGLDYAFRVDDYLKSPIPDEPQIEMHVLPQRDVLRIVDAAGCRVLEIREDDRIGSPEAISNTFFVEKPA